MTDEQLAKISVEIDRLQEEAGRLEMHAAYEEIVYMNLWASLDGPPRSIVIDRHTAGELRKKAQFLDSVKRGEANLSDLHILNMRIIEISRQIEELQREKGATYIRMSFYQYLAGVIK
ncbi:MAG: hypothetical protein HYT62_04840 [Candidatus Yanofskybacteria bacterium]|nr:hypothetical protein [Candidatus Yanofskybacteria bacterium]